ncbi:MAG: DNA primase [Egibacteraceae bacterium]
MAGRINDEDIQSLRERADLARVVAEYTSLRPSGGRLKGLCPFHDERTPSFTVDNARNLFHCFGCGEGGDVFAFLQQIEALSFPEAVERLARIEGVSLRYTQLNPGQRRALGRRTRLTACLEEAAAWYADQLERDDAMPARAYLEARGLTVDQRKHFQLGWAPDRWDGLVRALTAEGFAVDELVAAGLASPGRQGHLDRFRGRVMFPIFDAGGRDVVAFGGRTLPDIALATGPRDGPAPKYINSPETDVYRKSRVLYGLNWARVEIQRSDTALVVEGYMDVIGLHAVGVRNAVATCGTALTADHLRQLEKFGRRVMLALDADSAGLNAAERARELADEVGLREVGVVPLPEGQDPADLARRGSEAVQAALASTQTAVEFQMLHLLRDADVSTPEGQVEAYRRTFPLLARLPDRALRYRYVRDVVAPAVRLSADLIERELDAELASGGGPGKTDAPPARVPPTPPSHGVPRDPQLRLERLVLQALLQTEDADDPVWAELDAEDFTSEASRMLFVALIGARGAVLGPVLDALPDEETRARVRALALEENTLGKDPSARVELVARLRAATRQRHVDRIKRRLQTVGEQLELDERRRLTTELMQHESRRRELLEGGHR